MRKEDLVKGLEKKLSIAKDYFIEGYLTNPGILFDDENSYSKEQRDLAMMENNDVFSERIKFMQNVLKSVKQERPTRLSNANDNSKDPVYNFLNSLVENAKNYFDDAQSYELVIDWLVEKYDKNFPCEKNGFDWEVYYEGGDVYLFSKRNAVEVLKSSFVMRGVIKSGKEYTSDDLFRSMTVKRYNYLKSLAEEFEKNKESEWVIDFVLTLPGNNLDFINLSCDTVYDFKLLDEKYLLKKPEVKKTEFSNKHSDYEIWHF